MKRFAPRPTAVLALAATLLTPLAHAEDPADSRGSYFPLVEGWTYVYKGGAGFSSHAAKDGSRTFVTRKLGRAYEGYFALTERTPDGELGFNNTFGFELDAFRWEGDELHAATYYERADKVHGDQVLLRPPYEPGVREITVNTYGKKKPHPIRVAGFERVETPVGTFRCLKLELGARKRPVELWLAEGIGVVKASWLGTLQRCEGPKPGPGALSKAPDTVKPKPIEREVKNPGPVLVAISKRLVGTWRCSTQELVLDASGRLTQRSGSTEYSGTWEVLSGTADGFRLRLVLEFGLSTSSTTLDYRFEGEQLVSGIPRLKVTYSREE